MTPTTSYRPPPPRDPYQDALDERARQINLDFFSPLNDYRKKRIFCAFAHDPADRKRKNSPRNPYSLNEVWVQAPTEFIATRVAKNHFKLYSRRFSHIYECSWQEYAIHLKKVGFEIT
jgi:hypothetical protein